MPKTQLVPIKITLPVDVGNILLNAVTAYTNFCMSEWHEGREGHETEMTVTVEYWILWWPEPAPARCTWRIAQREDVAFVPH
jgi:hypothetical protein